MKLYTEEEIVNFLKKEWAYEIDSEMFIKNLTPIELPSDEEINKQADLHFGETYIYNEYKQDYIKGAKWMRNKIRGGNQ